MSDKIKQTMSELQEMAKTPIEEWYDPYGCKSESDAQDAIWYLESQIDALQTKNAELQKQLQETAMQALSNETQAIENHERVQELEKEVAGLRDLIKNMRDEAKHRDKCSNIYPDGGHTIARFADELEQILGGAENGKVE